MAMPSADHGIQRQNTAGVASPRLTTYWVVAEIIDKVAAGGGGMADMDSWTEAV